VTNSIEDSIFDSLGATLSTSLYLQPLSR